MQHTAVTQEQSQGAEAANADEGAAIDHSSCGAVRGGSGCDVVVVCRRGNDSQHIVQSLREHGIKAAVDLIGGLSAWSHQADPSFPHY